MPPIFFLACPFLACALLMGNQALAEPVGIPVAVVRGWHIEVEPGQYGIQGSLGWGKMIGSTGGTQRWMHTVYWGWAVRGIVVRQWGSDYAPLGFGPQTVLGLEGNLSIVRLNFTAGVLRSLSSVSNEEWLVTGSLGWGF